MTANEGRDIIRQTLAKDWRLVITSGFIYIKTKKMELIPLKLNTVQKRLMMHIWNRQQAGKPIRLLIPKARQHGISTFTEAMIYSICSFQNNINSIIIADNKDKARGIFEMSKLMHRKMDLDIRTETLKTNATELSFEETESKIVVSTDARSGTFHIFHSSETAFYRNAPETMLGALQTIPDEPGTMVIMESTGNGQGNYFHIAVLEALAGRSKYEVFFIPWFDNPDYSLKAPADFQPVDGEWGDEPALKAKYNLTNDQLYWRRDAIKEKCGGDLRKFMQEYPATVEECFQGSGYPVFDHEKINEMEAGIVQPRWSAWLEGVNLNRVRGIQPAAYIFIWEEPAPETWKHRYVVGADTGGTYEGADYCAAYIYDRVTRKTAAMIHGHFDAYEYARILVVLATYYHMAKLAIEVNVWTSETDDLGTAVIDNIKQRYKYKNFYTRKTVDKVNKTETKTIGWWTDHTTKQIIVDTLRNFVNNWTSDPIGYNDGGLLSELRTYIVERTRTGITTWNASEGQHDDKLIAFGIALIVASKMPRPYIYYPHALDQKGTDNIMKSIV